MYAAKTRPSYSCSCSFSAFVVLKVRHETPRTRVWLGHPFQGVIVTLREDRDVRCMRGANTTHRGRNEKHAKIKRKKGKRTRSPPIQHVGDPNQPGTAGDNATGLRRGRHPEGETSHAAVGDRGQKGFGYRGDEGCG